MWSFTDGSSAKRTGGHEEGRRVEALRHGERMREPLTDCKCVGTLGTLAFPDKLTDCKCAGTLGTLASTAQENAVRSGSPGSNGSAADEAVEGLKIAAVSLTQRQFEGDFSGGTIGLPLAAHLALAAHLTHLQPT